MPTRSKHLVKVARMLHGSAFLVDIYARRFQLHPEFNPDDAFPFDHYLGYFGEHHLDYTLETIASQNSGVELDPELMSCYHSRKFWPFRPPLYTPRRKLLLKPYPDGIGAEYDRVACIHGLYSVFEIKMSKRLSGSEHSSGTIGAMQPERIDKKLRPLRMLLGRDVGYVLVIPAPEHYALKLDPLKIPEQWNWRKELLLYGGLVAYLPFERERLQQECLQAIEKAGLKIRE